MPFFPVSLSDWNALQPNILASESLHERAIQDTADVIQKNLGHWGEEGPKVVASPQDTVEVLAVELSPYVQGTLVVGAEARVRVLVPSLKATTEDGFRHAPVYRDEQLGNIVGEPRQLIGEDGSDEDAGEDRDSGE